MSSLAHGQIEYNHEYDYECEGTLFLSSFPMDTLLSDACHVVVYMLPPTFPGGLDSLNAHIRRLLPPPSSGEEGRLIVSAGPVAPVALGVPQTDDDGVLTVTFEKNPLHLNASSVDYVHLYVYCPAVKDGYLAAPVYRKERKISVALPDSYLGGELHVYAFVTDNEGRASATCYAGVSEVSEVSEYSEPPETSEYMELADNPPLAEGREEVLPDDDVGDQSMQLSLFPPL